MSYKNDTLTEHSLYRHVYPRGIAINRPTKPHKKSAALVSFLTEKLERGLQNPSERSRSADIAYQIRTAKCTDGRPMFQSNDWLTDRQVKQFMSGQKATKRQKIRRSIPFEGYYSCEYGTNHSKLVLITLMSTLNLQTLSMTMMRRTMNVYLKLWRLPLPKNLLSATAIRLLWWSCLK